jgi:hypothetical protein
MGAKAGGRQRHPKKIELDQGQIFHRTTIKLPEQVEDGAPARIERAAELANINAQLEKAVAEHERAEKQPCDRATDGSTTWRPTSQEA